MDGRREDTVTAVIRGAAIGALLLGVPSAHAATVHGHATIDGRPAADAVVYLDAPAGSSRTSAPDRVVMDQKNLAFTPHVLPVVRGTVIEFTNSDDVQHNVFSPSAVAGRFDLGTYGPGAARQITLDQPGEVLVLCNIHMEMEAHILVLDGPYASTVGEDGSFRIPDVPAGTYTVRIWKGSWLTHSQVVDVDTSESVTVNVVAAGE
jgi:plastocyanin